MSARPCDTRAGAKASNWYHAIAAPFANWRFGMFKTIISKRREELNVPSGSRPPSQRRLTWQCWPGSRCPRSTQRTHCLSPIPCWRLWSARLCHRHRHRHRRSLKRTMRLLRRRRSAQCAVVQRLRPPPLLLLRSRPRLESLRRPDSKAVNSQGLRSKLGSRVASPEAWPAVFWMASKARCLRRLLRARQSRKVCVGGSISAPRLVHRVAPDYPYLAQAAQIEGIVILEATVDEAGAVHGVRVLLTLGPRRGCC